MDARMRRRCGEVSEWLKEHAWKVCKRLIPVSRVRIPLSPPVTKIVGSISPIAATSKPQQGGMRTREID